MVDFELDASGNTFVTGTSFNGSDYDIVTVKYDNTGTQLWTNTYGGGGLDEAKALTVDGNGDVIVTGARFISGNDWDLFVLKVNGTTGVQSWAQVYTGSTLYDIGNDVAVNAANEIYVVGEYNFSATDLDYIVIKYSSTGTQMAVSTNGGGLSDRGLFIELDASSNVYLGGTREFANTATYFDFRVMKFSSDLSTITWTSYGDSGFSNIDAPNAMTMDAAGNIYIGGQGFVNTAEGDDYLVMKFNNSGVNQWIKMFSGDDGNTDNINALVVDDATGNLYVTGKIKSTATAEDYMTIAYNSIGDTIWTKQFTTAGLGLDEATDIELSTNNFLYVTGYSESSTNNDYYTIKYDLNGVEQWNTRFDGPASNSDKAVRMKLDASDNIFITGSSHGGPTTNLDYSTIKYCQLETIAPADVAICAGQSTTLTASSVGGLGSNFQWTLVSGDPITASNFSCTNCTAPVASPSITSTYAVSSQSASGCIDYDTVTVTVNTIPSPTVYNEGALTFCLGDSVRLYTDTYVGYSWTNGDTDSTTYALTAGTYTVTITDINGCQANASATVVTNSLPTVDAGPAQTICPENTAQLQATGATTYAWDVDATLSQLLIDNPIATPTTQTKYYVTGTDGNGCENRDSVVISLFTSPAVVVSTAPATICVNDSIQLSANGATSYVWDPETSMPIQNISNPWVYPTTQTKYIVTGTDGNGCTARDSVTISTNNLPFISAGVDQTICEGDSAHIFATGALSYLWQNDPTLDDINSSNPWAKPSTQNTYIVEGTDINGCKNTDTVIVFVNPYPTVNAGLDTALCIGSSIQLQANGAISYLWNTSPTLTPNNVSNPTVNPTVLTTYIVQGTDANGCKNTDTVDVAVNSLPTISAGSDSFICDGDSLQLNASGGVSYIWSYHPTLGSLIGANPWAYPTQQTTYTVQGTDANGCSDVASVIVGINPLPLPPTILQDSIYLISDSLTGNQWYLDGNLLTGETNDTLIYSNYTNGNYTIVYTDGNGCSSSSTAINATITIVDVSVGENPALLELSVYPNPTTEILNIEANELIEYIIITDLNGKIVYQEYNLKTSLLTLNLYDLTRGIYLVKIGSENSYNYKKIIKE